MNDNTDKKSLIKKKRAHNTTSDSTTATSIVASNGQSTSNDIPWYELVNVHFSVEYNAIASASYFFLNTLSF